MEKMYPPVVNSPKTELTELITDTQTEIAVANASVLLPGEGIAVLGNGDVAETITYTSVEENVLKGCVRGFEGIARAWPVGTRVARNFTAADFRAVQDNVTEANGKVATLNSAVTDIDTRVNTLNNTVTDKTQDASLTKKGVVQLSKTVDGTRDDIAATESAVKTAYDLANSRETPAGAQAKANAAETNAKNASLSRGGGSLEGGLNIISEADILNLVGSTHVYIGFYPKGIPNGRKGYLGFGDPGNTDFSISNPTGKLVLSDQSGGMDLKNLIHLYQGNGSPEGTLSAPVGALYRRWDGGVGTTLYVKQSGDGNTGWRAV
ncbi:Phage tail fiber repeat protein [compost metagenome]